MGVKAKVTYENSSVAAHSRGHNQTCIIRCRDKQNMTALGPDASEQELIEKFRVQLRDLELPDDLSPDTELLRWIRARENNLDQAESMLRKHLIWRKEINYAEIRTWEQAKEFQDLLPEEIIGFDDDNSPIVLSLIGRWDVRKLVHEGTRDNVFKPFWQRFFQMKDLMADKLTRDGVPVTQVVGFHDLDGLSFSQGTFRVFRALSEYSRAFEANFPEMLKICVVINAPGFFSMFFNFMKQFLSERTFGKIHVFGKDRQEWEAFLKQTVPDHVLPTLYGGSNDKCTILK